MAISRPLPLSLRAPVFAAAPMVTQSDRAFRRVARRHGCTLLYTEMVLASSFAADEDYRKRVLGGGVSEEDRPLVVQFAVRAGEEAAFLAAALAAQAMGADAVDLNLGCPQRKAREGGYGAWLAADSAKWPAIAKLVSTCAEAPELRVPIFCKIRLQASPAATVALGCVLEQAGCSLLAIHGRQLHGEVLRRHGPADLLAIARVREALSLPVLANGNVRCAADVRRSLRLTACEGVMCAEQLLRDPALFERSGALFSKAGLTCGASHRLVAPCAPNDWVCDICCCDAQGAALACDICDFALCNICAMESHAGSFLDSTCEEPTRSMPPNALLLADEYLEQACLADVHARDSCTGERFTVWTARDADIASQHLRSILTGRVGAEEEPPNHTELLVGKAERLSAIHFMGWWRLAEARTVGDVAACYNARRHTLEKGFIDRPHVARGRAAKRAAHVADGDRDVFVVVPAGSRKCGFCSRRASAGPPRTATSVGWNFWTAVF